MSGRSAGRVPCEFGVGGATRKVATNRQILRGDPEERAKEKSRERERG